MNIPLSNGHTIKRVVTGNAFKIFLLRIILNLGFINPDKITFFTNTMDSKKALSWGKRNTGSSFLGRYSVVVSITGKNDDFVLMVEKLNGLQDLAGIEIVPVISKKMNDAEVEGVINGVRKARRISRYPIIVKLPVDCHELTVIARLLHGVAQAISIDEPESVFGNGSRYMAVRLLSKTGVPPVISSTVGDYSSFDMFKSSGASAVRVGSINPFRLINLITHHG